MVAALGVPDSTRGLLFDLDGVLTQTAKQRAAAWNQIFDEFLAQRARTRDTGVPCAVVTSSANTDQVVTSAKLSDLFDARVDGLVAARERLPGKPAPDTFLAGAWLLGLPPDAAVVFEDALVGVAAGRAGRFGRVVGVDRIGQADELPAHGADIVVRDLAELLGRT